MAVQILPSSPSLFSSLNLPSNHVSCVLPSFHGRRSTFRSGSVCSQLFELPAPTPVEIPWPTSKIDRSLFSVSQATSEAELWSAACLRVRTFYDFDPNRFGIEDHKKHLAEHEFEALKERVSGLGKDFRKVSCINATLPLSVVLSISDDLCSSCKFATDGEYRVVVGSLDLNQCVSLPNEIIGEKPKGIGADFARAYLSNVCVAKELHRNGLGYELVAESTRVAENWGISNLYVHVAVNNLAAKNLYTKSGFTFERDEPAWEARYLDRPRRLLLWKALPISYEL